MKVLQEFLQSFSSNFCEDPLEVQREFVSSSSGKVSEDSFGAPPRTSSEFLREISSLEFIRVIFQSSYLQKLKSSACSIKYMFVKKHQLEHVHAIWSIFGTNLDKNGPQVKLP